MSMRADHRHLMMLNWQTRRRSDIAAAGRTFKDRDVVSAPGPPPKYIAAHIARLKATRIAEDDRDCAPLGQRASARHMTVKAKTANLHSESRSEDDRAESLESKRYARKSKPFFRSVFGREVSWWLEPPNTDLALLGI